MNYSLFDGASDLQPWTEDISEGALILRHFSVLHEITLLDGIRQIMIKHPFRQLLTPNGHRMSVAMTCCGEVGWVSDSNGYRYSTYDPDNGKPWPYMPDNFFSIAVQAAEEAGFPDFKPDSCLINQYQVGSRLSLHQDKDEKNLGAPIVSFSLGIPATFLFGGMQRTDPVQRYHLAHGDVVVWGGPARLRYHGVAPIKEAAHPLLGTQRINLTFRQAK
ncbi:MAG: DNA oxidative demethylase AlkB [Undibacterium umbellatum]|uniref:DNA oxidative demethylase AlkB n=1 Tax=Undibacterium umbellatum TaxID=2762300 RepID=UPI003BB6E125